MHCVFNVCMALLYDHPCQLAKAWNTLLPVAAVTPAPQFLQGGPQEPAETTTRTLLQSPILPTRLQPPQARRPLTILPRHPSPHSPLLKA